LAFDLSRATAPVAKKIAAKDTRHGITRTDNYAWLRADNWQEVMRDPQTLPSDIRQWLEAENTYYETIMEDTGTLQDNLFEELKGRIKQDDSSVPSPHGEYSYQSRYEEGKEYPLYVRAPRGDGDENILFDGPKEAKPHEYFDLGLMSHSPDHTSLAWSVDTNGSEYYHMQIRDLATGKDGDEITKDVGSFAWGKNAKTYAYVKVDENHRPSQAFVKREGMADALIYEEQDPRFYVGIGRSLDGTTLELSSGMNDEDEVRLISIDDPMGNQEIGRAHV